MFAFLCFFFVYVCDGKKTLWRGDDTPLFVKQLIIFPYTRYVRVRSVAFGLKVFFFYQSLNRNMLLSIFKRSQSPPNIHGWLLADTIAACRTSRRLAGPAD